MKKEKTQWHALYIHGEDEPIAIFRDSHVDHGQQAFRKSIPGWQDNTSVVAVDLTGFKLDRGAKAALEAAGEATEPEPDTTADDITKADIRTQMTAEERNKRLTQEVKREIKSEK